MTTMTDSTRRNVHVYSSSNGTEVAGEFKDIVYSFVASVSGLFQHGVVSISTFIGWIREGCYVAGGWDLYPCKIGNNRAADGPALDRNSGDELPPGRYVMRTPPPGEFAAFSDVLNADICITESGQVIVYLTTDVPRTRAYSVNYTYTPDVRLRLRCWN